MTTAQRRSANGHGNDDRGRGFSASGLRPADAARRPIVRIAAGPFDVSADKRDSETSGFPGALVTGLLVVYPAFATVAAIVIGLVLSGPAGGA